MLQDHKGLRAAPSLVLSDRVQQQYPQMICDLVESVFTVTNPAPKAGSAEVAEPGGQGQRGQDSGTWPGTAYRAPESSARRNRGSDSASQQR